MVRGYRILYSNIIHKQQSTVVHNARITFSSQLDFPSHIILTERHSPVYNKESDFVGSGQSHATSTIQRFWQEILVRLKLEGQSPSWSSVLLVEGNVAGCKSVFSKVHLVLYDLIVLYLMLSKQLLFVY